jgi:uncharacterized protein YndB with AHSA1/START domain
MSESNEKGSAAASAMEREIEIVRIFDAPRELVYKAWIEPQRMQRWFGPRVFTNPVCELDARPGGKWRIVMRAPDGAEYPAVGVYEEVSPPERLVFTNNAVDKDGNLMIEGHTTVTFEAQGNKTRLTLRTRGVGRVAYAPRMLAGMEAGWSQSLDKLEALLAE